MRSTVYQIIQTAIIITKDRRFGSKKNETTDPVCKIKGKRGNKGVASTT